MNTFITFNPHIENLSQKALYDNFRKILQKYYRKTLGQRYFKHKDKQFQILIVQEIGSKDFKQPHLHIIVDLPLAKMREFYHFLKNGLTTIYPHLTSDCQLIGSGKYDEQNVYTYCLKEGGDIFTKSDLFKKIPSCNDK